MRLLLTAFFLCPYKEMLDKFNYIVYNTIVIRKHRRNKMYDLVIIGSGPAGLSAAIYAQRARLNAVVLEKNYVSGGQVNDTYEVDNYPGIPGVSGMELADKMRKHADSLGVSFITAEAVRIDDNGDRKVIHTSKDDLETQNILIATGARHSKLNVTGEDTYAGHGVSYCATCDGGFYRKKTVAVIGGGNVAVEDAIYLANLCQKVYLVHRRDELRADKILQEKLFSLPNVEIVWNSTAKEITGADGKVSTLVVTDKNTGADRTLDVNGVFIAVGIVPNSALFGSLVETDEKGYICAGEDGKASVPGFFAAGDVRTKAVRQIATAVGDGAAVIHSVQQYLNTKKW